MISKNWKISHFTVLLVLIISSHWLTIKGQKLLVGSSNNQDLYIFETLTGKTDKISLPQQISFSQTLSGCKIDSFSNYIFTNGCQLFSPLGELNTEYSFLSDTNMNSYCEKYGSIASDNVLLLPDIASVNKLHILFFDCEYISNNNSINKKDLYYAKYDLHKNKSTDILKICSGNFSRIAYHLKGDKSGYWIAFGDINAQSFKIIDIQEHTVSLHKSYPFPFSISQITCSNQLNLQFSTSGDKLAFQHSSSWLVLYEFDICSGTLIGPKLKLNNSNYDSSANSFTFSQDGKWLIIGHEYFSNFIGKFPATINELSFFKTTKIGVSNNPEYKLYLPYNFSIGKIFSIQEDKILIFNKFEDNQFVLMNPDYSGLQNTKSSIERLPFRYSPSINHLAQSPKNLTNKCISDIKEIASDSEMILYPNPAHDIFIISDETNTSKHISLQIYTIEGKLLSSFLYVTGEEIDISNLQSGIYIVNAIFPNNDVQLSYKLTVAK